MINGWLIKEFGLRIKQLRTEKKISQENYHLLQAFIGHILVWLNEEKGIFHLQI